MSEIALSGRQLGDPAQSPRLGVVVNGRALPGMTLSKQVHTVCHTLLHGLVAVSYESLSPMDGAGRP